MHWSPRFPRIQRRRWWYWFRSWLSPSRKTLSRLRQEIKARLHRVPISPGVHCRRWAIQRCIGNSFPSWTHRCCSDAWQWGRLWYLPQISWHWETNLHKSQQNCRPGYLFLDCIPQIRWCPQRRYHWVLNQFGSIPTYSFYALIICTNYFCWKGIPRVSLSCWNHKLCFRTRSDDGQMWPKTRKVHGLLHDVQRWCRPQGCQRRCRHHQDQENHLIRRLVPNWFQVRNQLSTTHCCSRWWSRQSHARSLHDLQHYSYCRSFLKNRP